ncbi:glyoxylase-like metal-dependent hydrolase (beta-lactamase superfamily II) [Streptomyces sp. Ag109_O5-1]|uniref:MBL fold metallo-hydrolase n=1 Tax=Streptomyces sp. Ag109_O5-1 TaxID=1938851 RepID=UPI000F4D5EF7|nr:MBL fold metallo-hydrolase [Streptomyces sp. Ag109_O5-1]RPE39305.1 glyoxylase-like metal-dependent hydrolase (beta-lactamase superfamily II) [Streptomyces sp. Ag109_O5-1]
MTSNALTYAVHVADGMPTTNSDVPPDQSERSWSPTSSILISNEGEALLVDPLFTIAQSEGLLRWLSEHAAPVTSVYVTHGHGDHWFGLGAVLQQYPGARAFALPEVVEDMAYQSSPEVLKAVWRAWFPEQIAERLVLAEPLEDEVLTVGGAEVRPVRLGHTDSDNTTCLHVPDLELVVAGDVIYNNVHLMLAASDAEGRAEWLRALDTVEALAPAAIVAGHKDQTADDDPRHIEETRRYILDFNSGVRRTGSTLELYEYMLDRHPSRINPGALWGSCRAAKG